MDWFIGLEIEMKVAIVSACGLIFVALINGVFSLINTKKKNNDTDNNTTNTITQNTTGNNNTIIGIQNNTKERDE